MREYRDQRKHPRQQCAAVVKPLVFIQKERAEEDRPRDDYESARRVDTMKVDLRLRGLLNPARDKQHAGEGEPGAGEVPSDDENSHDKAEDEERRSKGGELKILSGMFNVPRLEALDQPKRGDEKLPEDVFVGRDTVGRKKNRERGGGHRVLRGEARVQKHRMTIHVKPR